MSYFPEVAWSTIANNVQLGSQAYYYYITVNPLDPNEPGASTTTMLVDDWFIDYSGYPFQIKTLNIDGNANRIEVYDVNERGDGTLSAYAPYNGRLGYIYRPLNGAFLLTQAQLRKLDTSATDIIIPIEKGVAWSYRGVEVSTSVDEFSMANVTHLQFEWVDIVSQVDEEDIPGWQGGKKLIITPNLSFLNLNDTPDEYSANKFPVVKSDNTGIEFTDITENKLTLSDNTTANSSTDRHGFLPKLDGSTSTYMRGDGTWAVIMATTGDFLDSVIRMVVDNSYDPGTSHTDSDRFIILNSSSIHANFGTINKKIDGTSLTLGSNDIVQWVSSANEFRIAFDSSAAMQPATVTVGYDKNGNSNHDWTYNVTDDIWADRGTSTLHNSLSDLNTGAGRYYHLTSSEQSLVSGITSTYTELNYLDGTVPTSGYVMFGDGSKITGDSNFTWDNTNKRLSTKYSVISERVLNNAYDGKAQYIGNWIGSGYWGIGYNGSSRHVSIGALTGGWESPAWDYDGSATFDLNVIGNLSVIHNITSNGTITAANRVHTHTEGNSSQWNAAYSWGNHASAGYGYKWYNGWVVNPGYDANTIGESKSGFSYANNCPHNGPLVHFEAGGYGLQLNASYVNSNYISFRTKNGDNSTWNSWRSFYHTGNFTDNSSNWNTAYSWGNHSGLYASINSITYDEATLGNNIDFNSINYYRYNYLCSEPFHVPNYSGQTNYPWNSYGQVLNFNAGPGAFPFQLAVGNGTVGIKYRCQYNNQGDYFNWNGIPWYDIWTSNDFANNSSNWNAAYNDKINSASFDTGTGILSLNQQDGGAVTVDLDGRYGVSSGNLVANAGNVAKAYYTDYIFPSPVGDQRIVFYGGTGTNTTLRGVYYDYNGELRMLHPTGYSNVPSIRLSGANVISQISVNTYGHVTGYTSRSLTSYDIGAAESGHVHYVYNILPDAYDTISVSGGVLTWDCSGRQLNKKVETSSSFTLSLTHYSSGMQGDLVIDASGIISITLPTGSRLNGTVTGLTAGRYHLCFMCHGSSASYLDFNIAKYESI